MPIATHELCFRFCLYFSRNKTKYERRNTFFFVNYPQNSKIIYRRRKLFFTAIKMWTTFTHIDVGCEKTIGSESKMVDIILIITIAKKFCSWSCASSLFDFLFEKYARFLKMFDLDFFTVHKLSPIRFISKPFHKRIISS